MENIEVLIGKRIACARTVNKLTQEQLAEKCSMSVSTLSRIETGHNATSLRTLMNIASALNVGIDYILYDLIPEAEGQPLTPEAQNIIPIVNQMDARVRQLALDIILSISRNRHI